VVFFYCFNFPLFFFFPTLCVLVRVFGFCGSLAPGSWSGLRSLFALGTPIATLGRPPYAHCGIDPSVVPFRFFCPLVYRSFRISFLRFFVFCFSVCFWSFFVVFFVRSFFFSVFPTFFVVSVFLFICCFFFWFFFLFFSVYSLPRSPRFCFIFSRFFFIFFFFFFRFFVFSRPDFFSISFFFFQPVFSPTTFLSKPFFFLFSFPLGPEIKLNFELLKIK